MRKHAWILALAALWLALPFCAHAQWTNDPWTGMQAIATNEEYDGDHQVIRLGNFNYLVTWKWNVDYEFPQKVYYQILSLSGIPLLAINGTPIIEGEHLYSGSRLVSDGAGGAIFIFSDYRSGIRSIYGQRFDSLGNRLWGDTGIPLVIWPNEQSLKDVVTDSLGNGFLAWTKNLPVINEIHTQKFDLLTGERLWGDLGIMDCGGVGLCDVQQLVEDGGGGVYDVWDDRRDNPYGTPKLYAQHLDANGNPLWEINGRPVRSPTSGQTLVGYLSDGVPDGQGGGIWSYLSPPPVGATCLFRLLPSGATAWFWGYQGLYNTGLGCMIRHPQDGSIWLSFSILVSPYTGNYTDRIEPLRGRSYFDLNLRIKSECMTAVDNGIISFMVQHRAQGTRLIAHRISNAGHVLWRSNAALGPLLPNGGAAFVDPRCAPDGQNGAVCVWEDLQNYTVPDPNKDVYAQRVRFDGQLGNPAPPVYYHPGGQIQAGTLGMIAYTLPRGGIVRIELYDLLGRRVALLADGYESAGEHLLRLDDRMLPSGIYIARLTMGAICSSAKVVIWH